MSWWSGTENEGYWESQVKRPTEESITCPKCGQMAKRSMGSYGDYFCSNCHTKTPPTPRKNG